MLRCARELPTRRAVSAGYYTLACTTHSPATLTGATRTPATFAYPTRFPAPLTCPTRFPAKLACTARSPAPLHTRCVCGALLTCLGARAASGRSFPKATWRAAAFSVEPLVPTCRRGPGSRRRLRLPGDGLHGFVGRAHALVLDERVRPARKRGSIKAHGPWLYRAWELTSLPSPRVHGHTEEEWGRHPHEP